MAAFVRTGYDPSYGFLPQKLHSKLVSAEVANSCKQAVGYWLF